jgi:WD40 repeat protein
MLKKYLIFKIVTMVCVLTLFTGSANASDKPEIFVQLGHSGVQSMAFSADGKWILSGGDKTVKLWDAAGGREIRTYTGEHTGYVASVAFSADERLLLSSGTEGKIVLWDAAGGQKVRDFAGHAKGAFRAVFSSDGRSIVSGGMDAAIKFWDVASGELIRTLTGHTAAVRTLALSPDGKYLLSGSWDKTIKLWEAATGLEVRTFAGHTAAVNAVVFSPDGKYLLSAGGKDGTVRYWDVATGRELAVLRGHRGEVTSVAFLPDGRKAVSGSFDRTVRVWDLVRGSELQSLPAGEVSVFSVAISPDGRQLLAGSRNMSLWDIAGGKEILKLDGKVNWVREVAMNPRGDYVLSGNFDGTIHLWDSLTGRQIKTFAGTKGIVSSLAFSPDGKRMLDCRVDGPLALRDVESGSVLFSLAGQGAAAFSRDGKWILSGASGNRLHLWDAATGREVKNFSGHTDKIQSVAFSPDGRLAVSGSRDKTARLWDIESGRELRVFGIFRYHVNSVAFSPGGNQVLAGSSDNTVKLFDIESGRALQIWPDIAISSVAFSPDGRFVLTAGFDGIPKLLDVAKGRRILSLNGHKLHVYCARFSEDGKRIITGSGDGTVRLWDAASGREITQSIGFTNGEWIVITKEGYYNSSARGHEYLNIRRGNKVYGIDQFYDVFYRPDIVSAKLKGEDISGLVTLTVEEALQNPPPAVQFSLVPDQTGDSKVKVCYRVSSTGGGIGEVRLFQNGKLIKSDGFYREATASGKIATLKLAQVSSGALYQDMRSLTIKEKHSPGAVLARPKGESFDECVEMETIAGENEIGLTAFNAPNTVQSAMGTARFLSTRAPAEPHLYILAVGIDRYRDASINLKYAARDARDFISQLADKAKTIYKPANIHLTTLVDEQASKPNILAAIEKLAALVKHGDSFVFFNASHGLLLQSQYYIVTGSFAGTLDKSATLISSNEIVEMSKKIKSLSQLFIFDTCHAGGVDNIVSGLYDARMSVMAKKMGLHIYASAGSIQTALDGYQGNGLYTHALLEGLKNGRTVDKDKSGAVTIKSLGIFSRETTTEISSNLGHPQTPVIIHFGKDSRLFDVR